MDFIWYTIMHNVLAAHVFVPLCYFTLSIAGTIDTYILYMLNVYRVRQTLVFFYIHLNFLLIFMMRPTTELFDFEMMSASVIGAVVVCYTCMDLPGLKCSLGN